MAVLQPTTSWLPLFSSIEIQLAPERSSCLELDVEQALAGAMKSSLQLQGICRWFGSAGGREREGGR